MLNSYTILCVFGLIAFIQSIPTSNTDSSGEEEDSHDNPKTLFLREVHNKIDGTTHHIKSAGITYRQRINKNQCSVEYNGQLFVENSIIKIRKKVFRVEDCLLERVYHACGPNLVLMLSVVCGVVEKHKTSNTYENFKRESILPSMNHLYSTADRTKRVITESCCENRCSISELTRYCHG